MIIIEESESGEQGYQFWLQIFIFFDIFCCLAVIFPVIWYDLQFFTFYFMHRFHSEY